MITPEIKDFLNLQRLGYVATVSPSNKPNVSPKGTIIGWDSKTLAFADIRSPDTIQNLKCNPNVEISVIDPILCRGYLFCGAAKVIVDILEKRLTISLGGYLFCGAAKVIDDGDTYQEIITHYKQNGIKSTIHHIVLVTISSVSEVTSPLYDLGFSEDQIKSKWKRHFTDL